MGGAHISKRGCPRIKKGVPAYPHSKFLTTLHTPIHFHAGACGCYLGKYSGILRRLGANDTGATLLAYDCRNHLSFRLLIM